MGVCENGMSLAATASPLPTAAILGSELGGSSGRFVYENGNPLAATAALCCIQLLAHQPALSPSTPESCPLVSWPFGGVW